MHALAVRLVAEGACDDDTLAVLDQEIMANIEEISAFAEASAFPDEGTLFDYNYATPVPNDSRRLPGEPLFGVLPTNGVGE